MKVTAGISRAPSGHIAFVGSIKFGKVLSWLLRTQERQAFSEFGLVWFYSDGVRAGIIAEWMLQRAVAELREHNERLRLFSAKK